MDVIDLYKIYAPQNAKWTEWVRPVPFVAIKTYDRKSVVKLTERKPYFINNNQKDTAIFVDLYGIESIELGIELAKIGYRPIPVFNGTDEQVGSKATTDTYLVESALISGGIALKDIAISNDANPVFLLDNARLNRYRSSESIFDNSWDLYGQDIPSFEYFKANGINKIIVVGEKIERDLRKIFFKFQNAGIEFYLTDGYKPAEKVVLKKIIKEKFEKEEL